MPASSRTLSGEWSNLLGFLGWVIRFGRKIGAVARSQTILVVAVSIAAQLSFIIAFFLPVKILFLLEGTRVPRFFPRALLEMDRDQLIIYMAITALVAFVLYSVFDRLTKVLVEQGSQKVISYARKMDIVRNQEEKIRRAYRAFSTSLANLVFLLLSLTVLALIYRLVFFVVLALFAVLAVVFLVVAMKGDHYRQLFLRRVSKIFTALSNIGFLVVFTAILTDYLSGGGPNLIIALISILFARRSLSKLPSVARSMLSLFGKRNLLDALFIKGQPLVKAETLKKNPFSRLLVGREWDAVVSDVVQQIRLPVSYAVESVTWSPSSKTGITDLRVEASVGDDQKVFVARFFHPRKNLSARRERLILTSGLKNLPAPVFIGAGEVDTLECHLLDVTGLSPCPGPWEKSHDTALKALLSVPPPREFVKNYRRSAPLLLDTITEKGVERAKKVAARAGHRIPSACIDDIFRDINFASKQPVAFTNPDVEPSSLWFTGDGEPVLLHWGSWSLRPIGAQRPKTISPHGSFADVIAFAERKPAPGDSSEAPSVGRVALMSAFAKDLRRKEYGLAGQKLVRLCNKEVLSGSVTEDEAGEDSDDNEEEEDEDDI